LLVQVSGLAAGNTFQVLVKNHPDAAFVQFDVLVDGAVDSEALIEFLQPYNFLQTVLTGTETVEITEIETVADVSGSLGGTFFDFFVAAGGPAVTPTADFRFHFDVDNGSTPPVAEGKTLVEVDISANDSATDVATALAAAMDAQTNLGASSAGDLVTATNVVDGPVPNARDSVLKPTGFTFDIDQGGGLEGIFVSAQFKRVVP